MNSALKAIITLMLNKKIIGGKHTSEKKQLMSKTKWLRKEEYSEFVREYKNMLNSQMILRAKKEQEKILAGILAWLQENSEICMR